MNKREKKEAKKLEKQIQNLPRKTRLTEEELKKTNLYKGMMKHFEKLALELTHTAFNYVEVDKNYPLLKKEHIPLITNALQSPSQVLALDAYLKRREELVMTVVPRYREGTLLSDTYMQMHRERAAKVAAENAQKHVVEEPMPTIPQTTGESNGNGNGQNQEEEKVQVLGSDPSIIEETTEEVTLPTSPGRQVMPRGFFQEP